MKLAPLHEKLLAEFELTLQESALLWESYIGLPDAQRERVKEHYLLSIADEVLSMAIDPTKEVTKPLNQILNDNIEPDEEG